MNTLPRLSIAIASMVLGNLIAACTPTNGGTAQSNKTSAARDATPAPSGEAAFAAAFAYVAGGCFWCMESDFEKLPGVSQVVSGYTGGDLDNPTYQEVSRETTGHYEAVKISYDPQTVDYRTIIDYFFRHVDPLDAGGQFCDRGPSYRTAIFVTNDAERQIAVAAKMQAEGVLGKDVVTPIVDLKTFWVAEDYHQDYYKKNPVRYQYYRRGCGRDKRVAEVWGTSGHAE